MPKRKPKTKAGKQAVMQEDMHRFKHGTLKSGSGKKVTDRKQAIAIGLKQSGQSKLKGALFGGKRPGGRDSAGKREKRLEGKPL